MEHGIKPLVSEVLRRILSPESLVSQNPPRKYTKRIPRGRTGNYGWFFKEEHWDYLAAKQPFSGIEHVDTVRMTRYLRNTSKVYSDLLGTNCINDRKPSKYRNLFGKIFSDYTVALNSLIAFRRYGDTDKRRSVVGLKNFKRVCERYGGARFERVMLREYHRRVGKTLHGRIRFKNERRVKSVPSEMVLAVIRRPDFFTDYWDSQDDLGELLSYSDSILHTRLVRTYTTYRDRPKYGFRSLAYVNVIPPDPNYVKVDPQAGVKLGIRFNDDATVTMVSYRNKDFQYNGAGSFPISVLDDPSNRHRAYRKLLDFITRKATTVIVDQTTLRNAQKSRMAVKLLRTLKHRRVVGTVEFKRVGSPWDGFHNHADLDHTRHWLLCPACNKMILTESQLERQYQERRLLRKIQKVSGGIPRSKPVVLDPERIVCSACRSTWTLNEIKTNRLIAWVSAKALHFPGPPSESNNEEVCKAELEHLTERTRASYEAYRSTATYPRVVHGSASTKRHVRARAKKPTTDVANITVPWAENQTPPNFHLKDEIRRVLEGHGGNLWGGRLVLCDRGRLAIPVTGNRGEWRRFLRDSDNLLLPQPSLLSRLQAKRDAQVTQGDDVPDATANAAVGREISRLLAPLIKREEAQRKVTRDLGRLNTEAGYVKFYKLVTRCPRCGRRVSDDLFDSSDDQCGSCRFPYYTSGYIPCETKGSPVHPRLHGLSLPLFGRTEGRIEADILGMSEHTDIIKNTEGGWDRKIRYAPIPPRAIDAFEDEIDPSWRYSCPSVLTHVPKCSGSSVEDDATSGVPRRILRERGHSSHYRSYAPSVNPLKVTDPLEDKAYVKRVIENGSRSDALALFKLVKQRNSIPESQRKTVYIDRMSIPPTRTV